MIKKEELDSYINSIPAKPEVLRKTIKFLQEGKLSEAAHTASEDHALIFYLKNIVNKPIYGFKTEIVDIPQIFSILGINKANQLLNSYLLSIISPKKWEFFNMSDSKFLELQADICNNWNLILKSLGVNNKDVALVASIAPSSIIVIESIFQNKVEYINNIKTVKDIDYNHILKKLTGMTVADLCNCICEKWELSPIIPAILKVTFDFEKNENKSIIQLGMWLHMLLFFTFGKADFADAQLSDFIDFRIDEIRSLSDKFYKIVSVKK